MLAQAIDEAIDFAKLEPTDYAAEWKWDGIRVQAVSERGETPALEPHRRRHLGTPFPDVVGGAELRGRDRRRTAGAARRPRRAVRRPAAAAEPQDRRRQADGRTIPAGIRAYDLLLGRRGRHPRSCPSPSAARGWRRSSRAAGSPRIDLSPLQPFADLGRSWRALRADPPAGDPQIAEGLMLKRWDSIYEAGRPKGPWFKWKRDPHLIDAVLMYAQRGHGKRSSFYSDYTFGVWREDEDGAAQPDAGRQGLFRLHRRGAEAARQVRARQHHRTLRPGARGARRPAISAWCWRSPSRACSAPPATNPASPCASPASTASAGTSRRARRTNWRRWSGC